MDLQARRELNKGFGDTFSRGFELALTPTVFGAIGYWIDGRLGIRPILTIALLVFALVGMFIRAWYGYDQEMRRQEQEGAWSKAPTSQYRDAATETPA